MSLYILILKLTEWIKGNYVFQMLHDGDKNLVPNDFLILKKFSGINFRQWPFRECKRQYQFCYFCQSDTMQQLVTGSTEIAEVGFRFERPACS